MGESDFDGWADLGAQRKAEDEAVIQRYAAGEGRGIDLRPLRGFVQHVRGDIGPSGIISQVKVTGRELIVWYHIPGDGASPSPSVSVTDLQPVGGGGTSPAHGHGGLPGLAQASAATPPGRTSPAASPGTMTSPAAASAAAEPTVPWGTASG